MEHDSIYASPAGMDDSTLAANVLREGRMFAWRGRLDRLRFGTYLLVLVAFSWPVGSACSIIINRNFDALGMAGTMRAYACLSFVLGLPSLFLVRRRLHDLGRSGWWAILFAYRKGSVFLMIPMLLIPGNKGENRYGPALPNATWVFAVCYVSELIIAAYSVGVAVWPH